MKSLGIEPDSIIGVLVAECGFEPYERDDGLHPPPAAARRAPRYNAYLREHGYDGDNPWEHWANSGATAMARCSPAGCCVMPTSPRAFRDEHSETPYMTRRAMDFIAEAERRTPWCLHLSYIKPHWPYIAPEPYASMYGADDVHRRRSARRTSARNRIRFSPPIWTCAISRNMSRDEAREEVIPTYMGLIKQIDDQMGGLMRYLEAARPARHHDDRVHVRSRRLSRRSLDGREGFVPRTIRQFR